MNLPKGNAIALQQLRPVENNTGDILSGYVFELIKQKKADDAAKAKQAAENAKTWFDAYKDMKIDPTVTASMYQDTSNNLFLKTKDFIANARMISQNPTLSEQEKQKMYSIADNMQSQYNMYRSTMQNEKALAEYYKGNEDIANGTAFQLSDDIGFRAALDSHNFKADYDSNGNLVFKMPISPVSNETKDISLGEAVAMFSRRPEKDLLNGKGGLLDSLFSDGAKMKQSWSSDTTGYKTVKWEKFAQDNGEKYFDTTFGSYSPNYIDPRLKQYARQILGKDIQNENDYKELKKSVIDYMSTAVPTSNTVDVAKPTVVNVNNGRGSGSVDGENNPIFGSTVMKLGGNRFYNQDGVIIRGKAETGKTNSLTNEKVKKDVFVQAYWNPNGINASGGKGNVAYGIVIPVQGGSFVMRPLGTKEDKTGFNSAKKYLTNAEFVKLAKASNEYFQDQNNRQAGKFNPNVDFAKYGDDSLFEGLIPTTDSNVRKLNKTQR